MSALRARRSFILLVILAQGGLVFLLYSGTLSGAFVYDDVSLRDSSLVQVHQLSEIGEIFTTPGIPRRLGYASFALSFYLGGLDPFGYHLVNLALHWANGVVLFLLALGLLEHRNEEWARGRRAIAAAALGSALWLAHPVQSQAVAYIYQRFTTLAALFFLLSLLAYLHARRSERSGKRVLLFGLAAILGLLALATKENTAMLPVAFVLVELGLLARPPFRVSRRRLWLLAGALALVALVAAWYLGPNFVSMMADDYERRGFTLRERLLTELRVVLHYLGLLVYPHPDRLVLDYDFPLSTSLLEPPTTALALLSIGLLVGAAVVWARSRPILSFTIFWYFAMLAIESSFVPLDLVYEHRLYLPSTAPLVVAAGWGFRAFRSRGWLQGHVVLCLSLIGVLGYWTRQRCEVWRSAVALWEDNARKTPSKARVQANLGKAYLDAGRAADAERAFRRAFHLDPTEAGVLVNLANLRIDHGGDDREASALLSRALALDPESVSAHVSLGVLHMRQRRLSSAEVHFRKAIELEPTHPVALFNLAGVYFNAGELVRAGAVLDQAVELWPADPRLLGLRGLTRLALEDREGARRDLARLERLAPEHPSARLLAERLAEEDSRPDGR